MIEKQEQELLQRQQADQTTVASPSLVPPQQQQQERQQQPPLKQQRWQTVLRQAISPYLPPPVINAIEQTIDPVLRDRFGLGSEGTVTVTTTLSMAWFLWFLVVRIFLLDKNGKSHLGGRRRRRRRGKAIVEDDNGDDGIDHNDERLYYSSKRVFKKLQVKKHFDATVVLCGPSGSGKTRLFYQLCYNKSSNNVSTVTSLKPNVGISVVNHPPSADNAMIRYIDWPGHLCTASKGFLQQDEDDDNVAENAWINKVFWKETFCITKNNNKTTTLRFLLVLDATQPVKEAAAVLYEIWQAAAAAANYSSTSLRKLPVVIVCHKPPDVSLKKCKNARRIKIQLRQELEKLWQITQQQQQQQQQIMAGNHNDNNKKQFLSHISLRKSGLELGESLSFLSLYFIETSTAAATTTTTDDNNNNDNDDDDDDKSLQWLKNYCTTGELQSSPLVLSPMSPS